MCHGFGHGKKQCPTVPRVRASAGIQAGARNAISRAIQAQVVGNARHLLPGVRPLPSTTASLASSVFASPNKRSKH